jgi:ectoine hydroxylase-related dioxygenase (phytanoyl-CoA dioxygenase family)
MVAAEVEEAARLRQEGYLVVEGALPAETCDAVRNHVLLTTDEAARVERHDLFGNIQEQQSRYDLKLDLCAPVVEALNLFVARCGPLLTEAMGGRARLVELAAITSDTGAVAQPVHADTMHGVTRFLQSEADLGALPRALAAKSGPDLVADSDEEEATEDMGAIFRAVATETALIYTTLIALQDIEPDMGPTHVWPGTNTVEHHATLWGTSVSEKLSVKEADVAFGVAHRKMTLRKGDVVVYDSRTMHCGGANSSSPNVRRSVLVVSAMGPGVRPDGTTWTMLPSLRHRLAVSDFPLPAEAARGHTNVLGADNIVLPAPQASPQDEGAKEAPGAGKQESEEDWRPVPPLEEWDAAVQCAACGRWRPCSVEEAPKLTAEEAGFRCADVGFSCKQEQRFTTQEIDAIFG